MSKKSTFEFTCPYCFNVSTGADVCDSCGEAIVLKSGIPSFTDINKKDPYEEKLSCLTEVDIQDLDHSLQQIRDDYMDESVIDRYFKTRTLCWRLLASTHLSGHGLVIGDHDEKVGILLSELLEETFTVDTSLTRLRAQSAVAEAIGTTIQPIHSDLNSLPFPTEKFDVIIIDCRASEVSDYISSVKELLTEDGTVLLLLDGWPRETGITGVVGLGQPPEGMSTRLRSILYAHSFGISKIMNKNDLTVINECTLLSTGLHENQRAFDVNSQSALDWLLHGSNKTASTMPFLITRYVSRLARKSAVLRQCHPRYLFICKRDPETSQKNDFSDSILIAGKNRSTVLGFEDGAIDTVRKVPNSWWHSELNKNAQSATDAITGPISRTIPDSRLRQTVFGPERYEQPATGTPLDQRLKRTPENIKKHIKIIFEWLIEFQQTNILHWIEKSPEEVEHDLMIEEVELNNPPEIKDSIKIPQVIIHGDLFGSNIYIDDTEVDQVIDWEWAVVGSNLMIDTSFFILQVAEYLGTDFEQGFETLFLADNRYTKFVYQQLKEYCNEMGIEPSVVAVYLSSGYIERVSKDIRFNKRLDIDWPKRIQHVWNYHDEILNRIQ